MLLFDPPIYGVLLLPPKLSSLTLCFPNVLTSWHTQKMIIFALHPGARESWPGDCARHTHYAPTHRAEGIHYLDKSAKPFSGTVVGTEFKVCLDFQK